MNPDTKSKDALACHDSGSEKGAVRDEIYLDEPKAYTVDAPSCCK